MWQAAQLDLDGKGTWANPQPSVSSRRWDNNGMDHFNITGSRGLTNGGFFLDGIPNTTSEAGAAANIGVVSPPDAMAEFKMETNSYDAEYGRTGGRHRNVSPRSGTTRRTEPFTTLNVIPSSTRLSFRTMRTELLVPRSGGMNRAYVFDGLVYLPKLYDGRRTDPIGYSSESVPGRHCSTRGFITGSRDISGTEHEL